MFVRNPSYETIVRASFAKQGLMPHYGAALTRVDPGVVEIALPFRSELSQQNGFFHAGVTSAVADTACGYAALTLMPAGSDVLTVEFKINLLAPARGDTLIARGRVVRSGRTLTICQGDVYVTADEGELHCATITATTIRIDAP